MTSCLIYTMTPFKRSGKNDCVTFMILDGCFHACSLGNVPKFYIRLIQFHGEFLNYIGKILSTKAIAQYTVISCLFVV